MGKRSRAGAARSDQATGWRRGRPPPGVRHARARQRAGSNGRRSAAAGEIWWRAARAVVAAAAATVPATAHAPEPAKEEGGKKKIRVSLCLDQGEKGNRAGAQKKEITGESRGLWFPRLSGLTSSDPNGKKDKGNPLIFLDCGSGGVPIPRKKPRLNGNALEGVGSMRGEKKRYQPTKTQGEAEEMLPPGHMKRKDSGEPWTRSILCSNHGLLNKLPFAIHALSINQNW